MSDQPNTKIDFDLSIQDVDATDLTRIWERLSNIAQGFALEGYDVDLRTWRQTEDDDGHPALEPITVGGERGE